jgi:hypothetical protein
MAEGLRIEAMPAGVERLCRTGRAWARAQTARLARAEQDCRGVVIMLRLVFLCSLGSWEFTET